MMKINTTVLMSVVLVLTAFSAMSKPTFDVNVANFPLDEEGNLRVSSAGVTSKVITVVKDLNLSWTGGFPALSWDYEYFTVDVDGYNEFVVYASFRNWTTMDAEQDFRVIVSFVVDEIGAYPKNQPESIEINIWAEQEYFAPWSESALYHVKGTQAKLLIEASADTPYPAGWVLASVSLYLRN